ncbi:bifunctional 4-hydroxy-2-oxoglutarate aldolase/2-dehydro-3-deoxy-phosphogluconate aldolase [Rhizobacter sp. Root1221]|uniref:bifunctional 4-hydroxy-2-oxoglutarate aldolase/2-dehydro-3-deoxy-phosphogluconate aldolase n=1 Tax=Rhizobacter sp. Root1221 TaxID=1736433 RepID=UPI0006F8AC11|nr:bifunctional 4-hydroxy-2-oxoglutarate aldolase/2-dehydro-3-deoxy-phosphogluconate aldolase [Rhizobacter sp. Root1221]KQW00277.1 keto-deoxy-phosphogluconate aldolase [Rhizobacter sp. Root1221]
MKTREILALSPVMPVIALDRLADAVPLARALVRGGIRLLEVTLRTPVALDCVRAIKAEVPEAVVGVGTIVTPADLEESIEAGAAFGVSPGASAALLRAAAASPLPFVPGVMTPSDVINAIDAGFHTMKLFPAAQAGGLEMLKALGGPFPHARFCPTGGVTLQSAPALLALKNVVCVGGSWLTPSALIANGDWAAIETLARDAAALR